jgi:hypothetical protein
MQTLLMLYTVQQAACLPCVCVSLKDTCTACYLLLLHACSLFYAAQLWWLQLALAAPTFSKNLASTCFCCCKAVVCRAWHDCNGGCSWSLLPPHNQRVWLARASAVRLQSVVHGATVVVSAAGTCCPHLLEELGQHDACVPHSGAQVLRAGVLRQTQVDPATAAVATAAASGWCSASGDTCAVHPLLLNTQHGAAVTARQLPGPAKAHADFAVHKRPQDLAKQELVCNFNQFDSWACFPSCQLLLALRCCCCRCPSCVYCSHPVSTLLQCAYPRTSCSTMVLK